MKIRTLIVEDEPNASEIVFDLLSKDDDIVISAICKNGFEAVDAVKEHKPHLAFVDVQMPGLDGFGFINKLDKDALPLIIFTTAFDQYALKAFDIHALHYLLKPFSDQQFIEVLNYAKEQIKNNKILELSKKLVDLSNNSKLNTNEIPDNKKYQDKILIKESDEIQIVNTSEINWIEACDYYVQIQTDKKNHLVRKSLNSLESCLDPNTFIRIHRSYIINVNSIKSIYPNASSSFTIVMKDEKSLPVSSRRKHLIKKYYI